MSLVNVRTYLRDRFQAKGFREWDDAFNTENIPESVLDHAFHIGAPILLRTSQSMQSLALDYQVDVTFMLRGYRQPSVALDNAHVEMSDLLAEVLKPENRLTQPNGFANVIFDRATMEPLAASNDNAVIVVMSFICKLNLDIC